MKPPKPTFLQVARKFPDNESAEQCFIKQRWHDGVECPKCKSKKVSEKQKRGKRAFRCNACNREFSTKTGSLMHDSKFGFRAWAITVFLVTTNTKGTTSTKLAHDLGVMQKTAWYLTMRIREAYSNVTTVLKGEGDETYIGGKEANKHEHKKLNSGRGQVGKTAVIGIKDRETGHIVAKPVTDTIKEMLQSFIQDIAEEGSTLYTDAHKNYIGLKGLGYEHAKVEHSANQDVDGQAHTNGIESSWSLTKRGISGVHHRVSVKHLPAYVDEFVTQSNLRKVCTLNFMEHVAKRMFDRPLSYKQSKARGQTSGSG